MRGLLASGLVLAAVAALVLAGPAPRAMAGGPGPAQCPYSDQLTVVDAVIVPGEYAASFRDNATGITVSMQYNGGVMAIGLQSPGQGWVAISFSGVQPGTNWMNVIQAYVDRATGNVTYADEVDHTWERHWDTAIGGTNDVLRIAGRKNATGTTLEFLYPLNDTDDNDQHFSPGGLYYFSLAYSAASADFNATDTSHSSDIGLAIGTRPSFLPPEATRISLDVPGNVRAATPATIGAALTTLTGVGLSGQTVQFYVETTFGPLLLGNATTDNMGTASMAYTATAGGARTLVVQFAGQGRFLPSNASAEFVVADLPAAPPPLLPTDTAIALIVIAVVGSIWAAYGFVAFQVLGIRANAPEISLWRRAGAGRSTAGSKGRTMTEETPKPQPSVPAKTNKTTMALAAAALVLAIVGVALAGIGAVAPRGPAYAPQKVALQIAIVPDLQGPSWDVWLPNQLVVHAGDSVSLTVVNSDEMEHGLHIAEFGVDVRIPAATVNSTGVLIPTVTVVQFVPDHAGTFAFECNRVCGTGHDMMIGTLEVLPD